MGKAPTEDVIRALTLLCHQPKANDDRKAERARRVKYPPSAGWFLPSDLAEGLHNPDYPRKENELAQYPAPELLQRACEDQSTTRLCARLAALGVTERSRDGRFIRLRRDHNAHPIMDQFIVAAIAHNRFYGTKRQTEMTALLARHYRKYFVPKTTSPQEREMERRRSGIKILKRKYAEFLIEYQTSPESVQTAFKDIMSNETIPGEAVIDWLDGPESIQDEALTINLKTKTEADHRRKRKS